MRPTGETPPRSRSSCEFASCRNPSIEKPTKRRGPGNHDSSPVRHFQKERCEICEFVTGWLCRQAVILVMRSRISRFSARGQAIGEVTVIPHLRKPSQEKINRFLLTQSAQSYSYAEVGFSRDRAAAGYDLDHNRIALGTGRAALDAACTALRRWQMFPRPWTEIYPKDTPLEAGRAVVMLARVLGLWWMNACRIVYVIDEVEPLHRFGFAYGTLPGHVESGEERFTI